MFVKNYNRYEQESYKERHVEKPIYPIGKIFKIDIEDEGILEIINNDMNKLLKCTDYDYGNAFNIIETLRDDPEGFIILHPDYSIRGLIIFRYEKIPGMRSIILLYGEYVKLKEMLINKLVDYLKESNTNKQLLINAYAYGIEESYLYMHMGYKFNDAKMKSNSNDVLYEKYVYYL